MLPTVLCCRLQMQTMNEQSEGTTPPAKRMRRTDNTSMWWKCWNISECWWQYDRLQKSFMTIYTMKTREPFFRIPTPVFNKILTYVDLEECHQLQVHKDFDQWLKAFWWEGLLIPDWLWKREGMQRAFITIYLMKYRPPFRRIPASAFRNILTYCELEKKIEDDN